jgi:uroporphyrinogen decarboxylase
MWMEYGVFQSLLERLPGQNLLEYFRLDVRPVLPAPTRRETDFSPYFDREAEWDEWGRGRVWDDERHYAEYLYPLEHARSLAEVVEYPWPDLDENYRFESTAAQVRSWHEAGYAAVAGVEETVFEVAWQLRSMDALFEDIKFRPGWAATLLDRITELRAFAAAKLAEAGADVVQLGDDVAMQTGLMMNRDLWRDWFAPRLRRVIRAAKEANPDVLIWYHSDGNITGLIPDLIEVGVEVLNPVQPECVDQARVKRDYGDHLAFWGGLGVQSVLPFGTPDEVRMHVKHVIEALGADGGLVVGPAHVLERDTPFENILAMKQAIDEYGEY